MKKMRRKIIQDKKALYEAKAILDAFNKENIHEIDWSVFFRNITKKDIDEFALMGLNNSDLVFSDWVEQRGIYRTGVISGY